MLPRLTEQFRHRLAMPGNRDRFTLLHQFKQPGKLGLGFVYVYEHATSLVHLVS